MGNHRPPRAFRSVFIQQGLKQSIGEIKDLITKVSMNGWVLCYNTWSSWLRYLGILHLIFWSCCYSLLLKNLHLPYIKDQYYHSICNNKIHGLCWCIHQTPCHVWWVQWCWWTCYSTIVGPDVFGWHHTSHSLNRLLLAAYAHTTYVLHRTSIQFF